MSWKFWLVIASYCWLTTIPKSWEAWLQVFTVHFFTDVTAIITLFIQENYIMLPVLGHVINPQTYFLSHMYFRSWLGEDCKKLLPYPVWFLFFIRIMQFLVVRHASGVVWWVCMDCMCLIKSRWINKTCKSVT